MSFQLFVKLLFQKVLKYLHNLDFLCSQGINIVGPSNAESQPQLPYPAMYQLDIVLKKGKTLAIRDRTGRKTV